MTMRAAQWTLFCAVALNLALTPAGFAQAPKATIEGVADLPPEIKKHVEKFFSSDPAVQLAAVRALGEMGEKAAPAIPFLIELYRIHVHDTDKTTPLFTDSKMSSTPAYAATDVLTKMGKPAIEHLIAACGNDNLHIRSFSAQALLMIGEPAVDALIKALKGPGTISDDEFAGLVKQLADENFDKRQRATKAIYKLGVPMIGHVKRALSRSDDPEVQVRLRAVIKKLAPQLKEAQDFAPRSYIAGTLGAIGDRRAVEPLLSIVNDWNWRVRLRALVA
ncbi:MAG: hypothetical protein QGD94_01515, partial [Planctomycetia bacterium]|nr:hypothetical protein [Planctomycetia bacterium]